MRQFVPICNEQQAELSARSIANSPVNRLKTTWGMREIDGKHFSRCPRCGSAPVVLANGTEGVARCCDLATAVVNLQGASQPVDEGSLAFQWAKLVAKTKALKENSSRKEEAN